MSVSVEGMRGRMRKDEERRERRERKKRRKEGQTEIFRIGMGSCLRK